MYLQKPFIEAPLLISCAFLPVKSNKKKSHNLSRSLWKTKHREIIYDVIVAVLNADLAFSEKKEKEEKESKGIDNRFGIYFLC